MGRVSCGVVRALPELAETSMNATSSSGMYDASRSGLNVKSRSKSGLNNVLEAWVSEDLPLCVEFRSESRMRCAGACLKSVP